MNKIRLYFWALIGILVINACSDTIPETGLKDQQDEETLETGLKDQQDEGIVYAKVENASKYSNDVEVKFFTFREEYVELARSEWKDGSFAIKLPKTLNPNLLIPFDGVIEGLTISKENLKTKEAYFSVLDKKGNYVTSLYLAKKTEDGFVEAFYEYFDADAIISGSTTNLAYLYEKNDSCDCCELYLWKTNTSFSVEVKEGWNIWYYSASVSREERIITAQWSTTPISGLKWYGDEDFTAFSNLNNHCQGIINLK